MILLLSRHARTGGGSNGYDLNDHGHSCMLLAFTIRQWCNRAAVSLSPAINALFCMGRTEAPQKQKYRAR